MTHVVSTVQHAMSVPGQARPRMVGHGRGLGRAKPAVRRGLRRGAGPPPVPGPPPDAKPVGSVGNHPLVAPPPGPVAPHEEWASFT